MDIVDALQKHHEQIRALLETAGHEKWRFNELRKHLVVHHTNEELYFLQEIMGKEEVGEHAAEAAEEHYIVTFMLSDLTNFPHDHARWQVKYGIMQEFTEHHLREEEEDIFRRVRSVVPRKRLEELGKEYETVTNRQLEAF